MKRGLYNENNMARKREETSIGHMPQSAGGAAVISLCNHHLTPSSSRAMREAAPSEERKP